MTTASEPGAPRASPAGGLAFALGGIRPLLLLGVVGIAIWPWLANTAYDLRIFTLVGIYALLALGYQFIFGHAGALSLTQGTFFGIGAYVTAILGAKFGLSAALTLPLAIVLPVFVAVIIAAPVLRLESHYFALATLGVGQVVVLSVIAWESATGGSNGISGVPGLAMFGVSVPKGLGIALVAWGLVAAGAFVSWRITRGLYGAALNVARENQFAAQSLGIDTAKLRFACFVLSAAYAGLAGALYAHTIRVVSPEALEFPVMVAVLTIAVVGGRTHIAGAILGAWLIVNLPEWFRGMDKYYLIAYGCALLATVIAAPYGLIGWLEKSRARLFPEGPPNAPEPLAVGRGTPLTTDAGGAGGAGGGGTGGAGGGPGPAAAGVLLNQPLLKVAGLSKSFGGIKAVDRVSLVVNRGEVLGLIGPNGSGKTTLVNMITGIYRADAGAVLIGGRDITRAASHDIAATGIARTFQNINLVDEMSALDNVAVARFRAEGGALAASLRGGFSDPAWIRARRQAMHFLNALDAGDCAQKAAASLAYGLKRRVEIARALALQPRLLLLDEPAAGLNEAEQADLAQRLRAFAESGLSILVIEHNMPFLMPLAQRMICLDHGEVVAAGTPAQIRADARVIEAYLGVPET